jgi:CRISPR/Cas system CSM-associated protein Csm3 (group 7 of RAMP superfamily)
MLFDLSYKLTALSPLCPGSGSSLGAVQRQVLLDSGGFPVIKGSTIKGTIRYHLTRFFQGKGQGDAFQCSSPHHPHDQYLPDDGCQPKSDPIAAIFGTRQMPGRLFFHDARLIRGDQDDPASFPLDTRTCTAIDRRLGVVRKNHLFTMELIPAGSVFRGRISGRDISRVSSLELDDHDHTPIFLVPLLLGLRLTTHIGGGKSRGLGTCRFEPETVSINQEKWDIDDLSRLQDLWEQFNIFFPLRWEEEQKERATL